MITLAAYLIFVLTLVLVIWRPKGLSIGWSASLGAFLAIAFGVVQVSQVKTVIGMVWNATFAFIAAVLITLIMDQIGFFRWAALHMAYLARGNGRLMFLYVILLGAVVTAFFNNDGGALILTPIVYMIVRSLRFREPMILAFVVSCGFIADATSLPLVISNLVNIISADYFRIGFVEYASRMVIPNLFSLGASLMVLFLYFRKEIPNTYELHYLSKPQEAIKDLFLFRLAWVILAILLFGYLFSEILKIPVSLIAGMAAFLFILFSLNSPAVQVKKVMTEAPWSIVFFSIGMYLVVSGLQNVGFTNFLSHLLTWFSEQGLLSAILGTGLVSALSSAIMNNLPTVMIHTLAIDRINTPDIIGEAMVYAKVIGSDLGTKLTPIGSLATLLWLHVLAQRGLTISWGYFIRVGFILTLPTLLVTLLGFFGWLWLLYSL